MAAIAARGGVKLDAPRHILVVRTDRMGDMLVTTPLFAAIKAKFPACRLTVLASAAGAPIAREHPAVDVVEVDPIEAKGSGWRGTLRLARRLRRLRCDAAVIVYAKHRLAVAAWLARIPMRIGPGQRGYSFLFTHPVVQPHRRPPIRHETSYSLDLLRPLGIEPDATAVPRWTVAAADVAAVSTLLAPHGVDATRPLMIVHAGSGGSAMNWSPERYAELADCLALERAATIVITGGPGEEPLAARVCAAMQTTPVNLAGRLSVAHLAALMARSVLFVGSSTGPTHLAAAVGTPLVALYCPLSECLPERWRPQASSAAVLVPPVGQVCPTCLGPACRFFPCMDMITPAQVTAAANGVIATEGRGRS